MLQIGAKNSNFEIFESALYIKSVSMPLTAYKPQLVVQIASNIVVYPQI